MKKMCLFIERSQFFVFLLLLIAGQTASTALAKVDTFAVPSSVPAESLVFWNRLGTDSELENSSVGPGGVKQAGSFVQGVFGGALEVSAQNISGAVFSPGIVPQTTGCIEFWAKASVNSTVLPPDACIQFLKFENADGSHAYPLLHFDPNDGAGNGGLCARVGNFGSTGTGSWGYWTYQNALKGGDISKWHHYALVWNVDTISGFNNPVRHLLVYVDGVLNTGCWVTASATPSPVSYPENGRFAFPYLMNNAASSLTIDNLKIWNYAKTDFSDRFTEGEIVTYVVTVSNGSINENTNGSFFASETLNLHADTPPTGWHFSNWAVVPEDADLGNTFDAMQPKTSLIMPPHAISLTAVWMLNSYTVTFDADGGETDPAFKTVTYDTAYGELPVPVRVGFIFGGWWTDLNGAGTRVTADMIVSDSSDHTLHAHWIAITYAVTVTSDHSGEAPGSLTAAHGSTLSLSVTNSPAVFGPTQYVCVGVAVAGNAFTLHSPTNVSLTLTNNATLTWQWTTNYLLSTSVAGSGVVSGGGWYAADSTVQLTACPDAENLFTGWSDGEVAASRTVTVPEGGSAYTANFMPMQRGVLRFTKSSVTVSEAVSVVKLSVERVNGSDGAASVSYGATDGTASLGRDYLLEVNTLQWRDGETGVKSFYVEIADDDAYEGGEFFTVSLCDTVGASPGAPAVVQVNVQDNEEALCKIIRVEGPVDFGDVPTNRTAWLTVDVWNDGNQPLSVTNVFLPDGFSVTQRVFTVPAGGTVALNVLFAPTAVAAYAGMIEICSDATGGAAATAVLGNGTAAAAVAALRTITGLTAAIRVDVPEDAVTLGVEDVLAPGLMPTDITDGGTWDVLNRKVKWFFNEPGQMRDRVLQYTISSAGFVVTGAVDFGSGSLPIEGDTVFEGGANPALLHPADDDGDWRLILDEVAASVVRWRNGTDDVKTPVVVRGITVYLQGEQYRYDPAVAAEAKRWIPLAASSGATLSAVPGVLAMPASRAVRSVTATNVTVAVAPAGGTLAWGLEESVPEGLVVTWISDDGAWDADHRKVKWSFFDGNARTLSYSVTGDAGTYASVCGGVSFDGSDDPVTGASVVAVPLPFATWASRQGLAGADEALFRAVNAGCGQPNGLAYAFGGSLSAGESPLAVRWIGDRPVVETPAQDPATLDYVTVSVLGTGNLANREWGVTLEPATDQSQAGAGRCLWTVPASSDRGFFKIRATLK